MNVAKTLHYVIVDLKAFKDTKEILAKLNQSYPFADNEMQHILAIGNKVALLTQESQEGFGHAVHCAREWVGHESFMLVLGDHLFASDTDTSCIRQLMDIYERTGRSVVGLQETPQDQLKRFGCVTGVWEEGGSLLSITEFAEKPSADYAREHLATHDIKPDHYLAIFGQYILTPRIFELLADIIQRNMREGGSFPLTPSLDQLRQEEGFVGCRVKGRRFDIGQPAAYRQTIIDYPRR